MVKRKPGDRKDGVLLRHLDSMHFIVPVIYPNRCDNEAYISEQIDLTNINAYLEKKNASDPVFKFTLFQLIVAALGKTIQLRPKLNRFIANRNMYQRNEITASFVVKKIFSDQGEEALAILHLKEDDTLDSIHEKIYRQVSSCRSDEVDQSTKSMDVMNKIPRVISKTLIRFICFLDKHGWCPKFLIASDPYYSTVVLSNLGSIKLKCGYHHLTNWGTNSIFVIVGEKKTVRRIQPDGSVDAREVVELGLTIDERLADGYYYSKSIRLLKKLLEDPELLELPLSEEVEY